MVISQAEHLVSVLKFHPIYIVRGPKFAAVQESSPFVFPYASRNILYNNLFIVYRVNFAHLLFALLHLQLVSPEI